MSTGVVDLAELKVELETDPRSYGYGPYISSGEMIPLADLLNLQREELPPVYKSVVTKIAMNGSLVASEYYALAPERQLLWNAYTREAIDMTKAPGMRDQIEQLFPPASQTVTNLQDNAWLRNSSRAEELWGVDASVSWQQCSEALRLP